MVGVFWIEVVVNWIFLMIGRKIIRLYVKNDWISLIGIPIGFAIYVASYCFGTVTTRKNCARLF